MSKLEMQYKGNRSYLHGTDFFSKITTGLANGLGAGSIRKLSFKSFAKNQCDLALNDRPSKDQHVVGNGIWRKSSDEEIRFWIVETDVPVVSRYPFDEDGLIAPSFIEDRTITLNIDNDYSAIENIVAMTKKLNYALSPDINGKWVFGQIDMLKSMPDSFDQIIITRKSERKGMFSCNQILIDKEHVGEIRFIVGDP
ncbi:hypothetical protein [Marinomonas aquiplantarum]|uniref:Uncharacterized protein n=1 Tax=Marinomonas aquiplantarum TaxID=491951 RepID=A0A366D6T4_9GAMM|nr:hypothetical protein [Marinomonas aquiplantarum]RBO85743.1 hypothetical protein DFP76_10117 [Marinomonas aquiplantarum]